MEAEEQVATPASLPHGWVRLGERAWYRRWIGVVAYAGAFLIVLPLLVAVDVALSGEFRARSLVYPIVFFGCYAGMAFLTGLRYPQPWANFDTSEVRLRNRVVPMMDLDWAKLQLIPSRRITGLVLRFGSRNFRAAFRLRSTRGVRIDSEIAERIAEIVRRSSIDLPVDSYDPKGEFARYNFPDSITRQDAITLILDPPDSDALLPVLDLTPSRPHRS